LVGDFFIAALLEFLAGFLGEVFCFLLFACFLFDLAPDDDDGFFFDLDLFPHLKMFFSILKLIPRKFGCGCVICLF
jgi:hypothetical protein